MFVNFGNAGEASDVLSVLFGGACEALDGGLDFGPTLLPSRFAFLLHVLHKLKGLGQRFVARGEFFKTLVDSHETSLLIVEHPVTEQVLLFSQMNCAMLMLGTQ
jgi:hypothetical protein